MSAFTSEWYNEYLKRQGKGQSPNATAPTIDQKPSSAMSMPKGPVKLNKTESAFLEILKRRHAGCVIRTMPMKFVLAHNCTYLPDFMVTTDSGIIFYETKGAFVFEDGWVKFKTAARMFPEFQWIVAQYKKGVWTETEFK